MAQVGLACDILYFTLGSTSARMEKQIYTHIPQPFDLYHLCECAHDLSHAWADGDQSWPRVNKASFDVPRRIVHQLPQPGQCHTYEH